VLISDNGAHFIEKKLEIILKKYGVHHKYELRYHPQTSRQTEVPNYEIKAILEKMVVKSRKN